MTVPAAQPLAEDGWLPTARRIDSPNADARPEGGPVDLLVIHSISLPPGVFGSDDIIRLFTNRLDPDAHPYFAGIAALRVSAHFLIRRDGELIQFVSCRDRAWHAGVSNWRGRQRCNDFSIGVELEGDDLQPFSQAQYAGLDRLARSLRQAYPQLLAAGHSDIAPGRKTDPGPWFEWPLLASAIPLARV